MPTPQQILALTPEQSLIGGVVAALVNGTGNIAGLDAFADELPESYGYPCVIVVDHDEQYDTDTYSEQAEITGTLTGPNWRDATFAVECYAEGRALAEALAKQAALILTPRSVTAGVGFGNARCLIFRTGYSTRIMGTRSPKGSVIALAKLRYKAVAANLSF